MSVDRQVLVSINGQDVSDAIDQIAVATHAPGDAMSVDIYTEQPLVLVPEYARQALIALGWTPPEERRTA